MTNGKSRLPSLSAALAGIPTGIQMAGPWGGRRQLFVKFASEAETATIYTANALHVEITRLTKRTRYHSVAIVGRDSLVEDDFLVAAFTETVMLPVMIDHDGQRPDALARLLPVLSLSQVTLDGTEGGAAVERACQSITMAAGKKVAHAVAIIPGETVSDALLLRIVEQIHQASSDTQVIIHTAAAHPSEHDRRWALWLEQAMGMHADVRVLPKWPVNERGER